MTELSSTEVKLTTDIQFELNTGQKIPALGLGLGTVVSNNVLNIKDQVKTAIKAGYRHIDTAWFYGTEPYVGEALKECFAEGLVTRDQLFITSKVWPTYVDNIEASFNKSLTDLQLTYVDLYLQHWPVVLVNGDGKGFPQVPETEDGKPRYNDQTKDGTGFIEVYKQLEDLHLANPDKIRALGVSNYSEVNLKKLLPRVRIVPAVNQIEYHCQLPQQSLIDFCNEHKIHVTAFSPVGSYGAPILQLELVKHLAEKYNVSTNEIAIAYHILQGRSCLPRTSNLQRIKTNIKLPPITKSDLNQMYQIGVNQPKRYVVNKWGDKLGFEWWE